MRKGKRQGCAGGGGRGAQRPSLWPKPPQTFPAPSRLQEENPSGLPYFNDISFVFHLLFLSRLMETRVPF